VVEIDNEEIFEQPPFEWLLDNDIPRHNSLSSQASYIVHDGRGDAR
jgi:hypothetical protein